MVALSQAAAAAAAAAFQAFSSPASVQRSFNTSRLSVILSLPPCISPLPPRVWALASSSTPPASSGSPIDAHATRHRQRTGFNIGCSKYGVGIRSAAEVKETKGPGLKAEQAAPARAEAVAAPSALPEAPPGHSITFLTVASEEELLSSIWKEVEAKRIPPRAGHGMEGLYYNYRDAVLDSGVSRGKEMVVQIMATVLDRILLQFEEPFTFPSHHKAIREPYDYYIFGQNYIRPLVDFRNSYLGNVSRFNDVEQQLKQGHNVILFANHQTEADPAVMALLLESSHPYLAENLTYIAGDRVVLDPFCKPFSMGRNLLCVYSKKHINDVPELVEMKRKANTRTLKELALLLRKGGQLIWIAPSGGRDRPNPDTDEWFPAHFDVASVENMRRLIEQSRAPGHMYPLALLCYDVMPPPRQVEKELGEKRLLGFTGVGLSIANELKFDEVTNDTSDREQAAKVFSEAIWEQVHKHYKVLNVAVYGGGGLAASTSSVSLSQPWSLNSKISRDKHAQPCNSI